MKNESIIRKLMGTAIPLRGSDIDTDRIIPARYLRTVTFDNLGEHAFEDDRKGGSHPFDSPSFANAEILVANANFGCGSSREHAPQALMRWGLRAFIAESFAEIFFGNCTTLGLPCVVAEAGTIQSLQTAIEEDPSKNVTIDLVGKRVCYDYQEFSVDIPDGVREQLITGTWDSLGQLLDAADSVDQTASQLPYLSNFSCQR